MVWMISELLCRYEDLIAAYEKQRPAYWQGLEKIEKEIEL